MAYTKDERAYLWLCACTKTDYRERIALLRAAPRPAALLEDTQACFSRAGVSMEKISPSEKAREEEAAELLAKIQEQEAFAVTLLAEDYPASLKAISLPPLVLYGRGRRELLTARKLCVVGSRITPPWAEKLGKSISSQIAERMTVVTGLAEGGDLAAIEGALPSGNLISVLPCGLDECYPAAHISVKTRIEKAGLVLSEYPFGETAKKYSFHARNRILAGLSEGVLVLSAAMRSGALITANCALDFGRDVFALPYNAGVMSGEGCNDLIKKGAYLVTEANDVLSVYGMARSEAVVVDLNEGEKQVLDILRESGEMHLSEIASRAHLLIHEASAVLSALEIKGVAVKSGGNKYSVS